MNRSWIERGTGPSSRAAAPIRCSRGSMEFNCGFLRAPGKGVTAPISNDLRIRIVEARAQERQSYDQLRGPPRWGAGSTESVSRARRRIRFTVISASRSDSDSRRRPSRRVSSAPIAPREPCVVVVGERLEVAFL